MKHLGDICKLNGAEIPPVDVITFGAPCQDLSVAGKRQGMKNERIGDEETTRSGLFFEATRIIKEMRDNDVRNGRTAQYIRPRYAIYENVPGAFSSNGGKDFQAVLTEIVRIVEPRCPDVPLPETGKWPKFGGICDELGRWSVAWRTTDAQWWGVPQRRRRVCVLADFNGVTAADILFDPQLRREAEDSESDKTFADTGNDAGREVQTLTESVSGDSEQGAEEGEGTPEGTEGSLDGASIRAISFQERAGKPGGGKGLLIQDEHTGSMVSGNVQSVFAFEPGAASRVGGHAYNDGISGTVRANAGDNQQCIATNGDICGTLDASYYKGCGERNGVERDVVCYGISPYESNSMKSSNPNSGIYKTDTTRTLDLNGGSPACNQGGMAIVTPIEGNGQRESHRGNGYGEAGDPCFTLNSTEHHGVAVAVDVYNQTIDGDVAATLTAASGLPNTSGSKVMVAGFKPRQSAQARSLGYEEEKSPTINTDENYAIHEYKSNRG